MTGLHSGVEREVRSLLLGISTKLFAATRHSQSPWINVEKNERLEKECRKSEIKFLTGSLNSPCNI